MKDNKNNLLKKIMRKFPTTKKAKYITSLVVIAAVVISVWVGFELNQRNSSPKILTGSTLKKIVEVSDLSTFQSVYNGVAKIMNEKDPEEVDYYVAYEAKVKVGINFKRIDIKVDYDEKKINVKLPNIKINDINVDIGSMDYMFINKRANTETVSEQAYRKCIEDVTNDCKNTDAIFELARQNACNVIEALIGPFVEQVDPEFELIFD